MPTDFGYLAGLARPAGRDSGGDPDPYPNLAWLRETAPVIQVPGPGGAGSAWFVTSYALARSCLADPRLGLIPPDGAGPPPPGPPNRVPPPGGGLECVPSPHFLATDPPRHAAQRRAVSGSFSPRGIERLRGPATRLCHELIDRIAPRGRADLLVEYALPVPEQMTYELFGIPPSRRLPEGHATRLSLTCALREQPDGGPVTGELLAHLRDLLAYKSRHPGDDLTSRLLSTMDSEQALYAMYLLFATGQLSTGPFIAAAVLRLLQRPERYAALARDARRVGAVVEEALRYDSAVQSALPRYARADLDLDGVRIAAGEMVLLSLAAANRDPARYTDPDRFDPDRSGPAHLAFGHGIHFCLGGPLARLEGEVALTVLVRRLPDLRLDAAPERVGWALGPLLRSPREVPVSFPAAPPRVTPPAR